MFDMCLKTDGAMKPARQEDLSKEEEEEESFRK